MENVTEAIKMAGAVLMFVMALSITILTFGQARESSDIILNYKDRETEYQYVESQGTERTVNLETIIPAIFRAYLENYKIVFTGEGFSKNDEPIYSIIENPPLPETKRFSIDLETEENSNNITVGADSELKAELIKAIIYGVPPGEKADFERKFTRLKLPNVSLYKRLTDAIKNNDIIEKLGIYYQDPNPNIPDVMKQEKRIITYEIVPKQ